MNVEYCIFRISLDTFKFHISERASLVPLIGTIGSGQCYNMECPQSFSSFTKSSKYFEQYKKCFILRSIITVYNQTEYSNIYIQICNILFLLPGKMLNRETILKHKLEID